MNSLNQYWCKPLSRDEIISMIIAKPIAVNEQEYFRYERGKKLPEIFTLTLNKESTLRTEVVSGLVVNDTMSKELFAWLHSFVESYMPLSLHVRVLSHSDLNGISELSIERPPNRCSEIWACLTLGEILYRSNGSRFHFQIAGSWAESTCTRAYYLTKFHCSPSTERKLIERLDTVRNSKLLSATSIDLERFEAVWFLASELESKLHTGIPLPFDEALQFIGEEITTNPIFKKTEASSLDFIKTKMLAPSNSVEARLSQFDDSIMFCQNLDGSSNFGDLILGLSAFIVGRGPSHIHLLDQIDERFRGAYLWLTLFSSFVQRNTWPPTWLNLVRRLSHQLQPSSQFESYNNTDICWPEFDWMNQTQKTNSSFKKMPRLSIATISIELLPQITFQARIDPPFDSKLRNFRSEENPQEKFPQRELDLDSSPAKKITNKRSKRKKS